MRAYPWNNHGLEDGYLAIETSTLRYLLYVNSTVLFLVNNDRILFSLSSDSRKFGYHSSGTGSLYVEG